MLHWIQPTRLRRFSLVSLPVAVMLLATACGSTVDERARNASSVVAQGTAPHTGASVRWVDATSDPYWESLAPYNALEAFHFDSLASMISGSSVVIIGSIEAEGPHRVVEEERDELFPDIEFEPASFWGLSLRVHEVLAGRLPDAATSNLVLEFLDVRREPRSGEFPDGRFIAFLYRIDDADGQIGGDSRPRYALTSSQGLWVTGDEGAPYNPIIGALDRAESDIVGREVIERLQREDPLRRDVARFPDMDSLTSAIRNGG